MANNTIQLKRSSVAGKQPNTSTLAIGELAINLTDKKLYSSDGTNIFETGANLTTLNVSTNTSVNNVIITGGVYANGNYGSANQVLTSNGSGVYWATSTGGGGGGSYSAVQQQYTANGSVSTFSVTGGYISNNLSVYLNGVLLRKGTEVDVTNGSTFTITPTPSNGALIDAIGVSPLNANGFSTVISQQFTANGTANSFQITGGYLPNQVQVYVNGVKQLPNVDVILTSGNTVNLITTPANGYSVDVFGIQSAITISSNTLSVGNVSINNDSITVGNSSVNTQIFAGNVYLNGSTLVVGNTASNVTINSTSVYVNGAPLGGATNTDAQYVWTNTQTFSNTITFSSTINGVANNSNYLNSKTENNLNVNSALTSNSSSYLGGNTASDLRTYSDTVAAAAYSNATSYADTKAATAYTNATSYADNKAANAYSNATSYADTKAATAYSNSTSYADTKAATAYSNATSYADNKAANAYSNAIAYSGNAAQAYSNATSYADTKASTAYSNATTYSSNASNISSGTLAEARLPFRMDQNVRKADNIEFHDALITGNLTVSGNVTVIGANNLSVVDNMIYLNSNSAVTNPDLGFAGNYNDGTYQHTGFFRDASDGVWKVFDSYLPEPDASPYIDTSNTSFHIANFQANVIYVGNTSVYSTINTTSFSGTSNNSSYLQGYQTSTSGTANTIALRNTSGDIFARYLNMTHAVATRTTDNVFFSSTDAYIRKNDASGFKQSLSLNNVENVALSTWTGSANISIVNTAYIATLSANAATYLNGKTEANLNVNNSLTSNNSSYLGGTIASGYQTTAGLSANVATLTANNANNLGGVAAASYVNTSGSYTITGVHTHNANVVFGTSAGISANGGYGTSGQVLTSNGSAVYWATAAAGVNTSAQYTWSNTQTFSNTITFSSTINGTANNTLYLGGTAAAGYQTTAGLSANVATLAANSSTFANSSVTNTFTVGTASYFVSSGNLGIGTNSPSSKLDVTSSGQNIVISRSTGGYAAFQRIAPTGQQTYDFYTINGVEAGRITVDGSNYMSFSTGSSATERMRINSSGNMGIGTTTIPYKLVVTGDTNTGIAGFGGNNNGVLPGTNGDATLVIGSNYSAGSAEANYFHNDSTYSGTNGGHRFLQRTGASTAADILWVQQNLSRFYTGGSERMRIDSSGRIGFGVTPSTGASFQVKAIASGTADGRVEINKYLGTAASPSESQDWPSPALGIRTFQDFAKDTMLSFGYSNDAYYKTDDSVWNFRLNGLANATTSSSSTHLDLGGPGVFFINSSYTQSTGSLRAPIFYDSNDTGYYCDPNSTSTFITLYHNGGTAYFRGGRGVDQCCGDDGAISVGGDGTKPPRIAWHSGGIMEGTIEGSGTGWRKIYFYDQQGSGLGVHATGQIASNQNVVAYYSDRRLKEDFEQVTDHWNVINNLTGYRFTWNERAGEIPGFISNVGKREVGLIAQDVNAVYPEAVYTRQEGPTEDPYKTILHDRFTPVFVEALKDLKREIELLKEENAKLRELIK